MTHRGMIDRATLETHIDAAAAQLDGVQKSIIRGQAAWAIGAMAFVVLTDDGVDLRLDPAVAEAASRTPDTSLSPRGPEWVRFSPPTLDDHAVDRLEAWLALAWRRAGPIARSTK